MENIVIDALLKRRSIRKYKPDEVPRGLLDAVLSAGLYAANGGANQVVRFIVITGYDKVKAFARIVRDAMCLLDDEKLTYEAKHIRACRNDPELNCAYGAPVLILAAAPKTHGNSMADSACAVQNMLNAAYAAGLGSCYMNLPHWVTADENVRKEMYRLGMREDEDIFAGLCAGFADMEPAAPAERKPGRVIIN